MFSTCLDTSYTLISESCTISLSTENYNYFKYLSAYAVSAAFLACLQLCPHQCIPLEVLGVELGGDAEDSVVDSGDVGQLALLCFPVNIGLPQAVRTEVRPRCQHCMLVGTVETKQC